MIKVSGYRLGTAEIEVALVVHPAVAEAAAIGLPHQIKGKSHPRLRNPATGSTRPARPWRKSLRKHVRPRDGPHRPPRKDQYCGRIAENPLGKIMRRVLKARAQGLPEGDTSTLEA